MSRLGTMPSPGAGRSGSCRRRRARDGRRGIVRGHALDQCGYPGARGRGLPGPLPGLGARRARALARGDRRRRRFPRWLRRDPRCPARPPAAGDQHPGRARSRARPRPGREGGDGGVRLVRGRGRRTGGGRPGGGGRGADAAAARRADRRLREPLPGRDDQPQRRREVPAPVRRPARSRIIRP